MLLLCTGVPSQAATVPPNIPVISAEQTTAVKLSSTDVNRIICPSPIKHLALSDEKGMHVQESKNNLFIKFSFKNQGSKNFYTKTPNELFIVTETDVYNLIIYPTKMPSQTIWLEPSKKTRAQEDIEKYSGMPHEAKMIDLILMARADTVTEEMIVKKEHKKIITLFGNIHVYLSKQIRVEGQGLNVKVFTIQNDLNKPIQLNEKQFMLKAISDNPQAMALEKIQMFANEKGRLFVVEKLNDRKD